MHEKITQVCQNSKRSVFSLGAALSNACKQVIVYRESSF